MNSSRRRHVRQRGSALLIVFLFAAIVAIMLYREMPVAVFEARRQKEQLLIDRGNEYKHAVKLYYRKVGGYPASLDQLENTNRMRFLRHRYKDPFTGKDDWRLLHMGPGNMLLDSKVNRLKPGQPGAASTNSGVSGNSTTASTSTFGSGLNNSSSFGSNNSASFGGNNSSSFGGNGSGFTGLSSSSSESQPPVKVPPVPTRGPAIPAGGEPGAGDSSDSLAADVSIPMPPALPNEALPSGAEPAGAPTPQGTPQGNGAPSGNQSAGANATQMVQGLFGNQSPRQGVGGSSGLGTMQGGGGIAGVASKASGQTIKTVDDQSDYSLWEFYYDPTKDVQPGLAGNGAPGGASPAGATSGTPNSSSAPASNGTTSGPTGNSFSLGSGFGSEGFSQSGSAPSGAISSNPSNSSSGQTPPH